MTQKQWLCLMPHPYGWGDNQGRDIGALANGLRQLGERTDFFVLDERTDIKDPEVQLAGSRQLSDPAWWRARGRGVFLTTFGTSLMQPFYRAARQAGWKVWVRMDCDGVPGPDGGAVRYLRGRIIETVDRNRRRRCDLSGTFSGTVEGLARGITGLFLKPVLRGRLEKSYKTIDKFLIETPLAFSTFQDYFSTKYPEIPPDRLVVIPPAISECFCLAPDSRKTTTIIAVGQWWRMQKNLRLLIETILTTLEADNYIRWIVAGGGARFVQEQVCLRSARIHSRVTLHDHLDSVALSKLYATSQIIFYSSIQEGFPNTLCEALCSGVSFVAPKGIQAFDHCERIGWGFTYEGHRSKEAVLQELSRWRGNRSYRFADMAHAAQKLFHRRNVAERLVNLLTQDKSEAEGRVFSYFG